MTAFESIESMMRQAVADGIFPGAALVFSQSGQILFNRVYGIADLAAKEPVTHQTFFDLASLTKPLATAPAIMKLIEQKKLNLDQNLGEVIPAFSGNEKSGIRIRDLLSHRSGLPDYQPYYLELGKLPFDERKAALRRHLVEEPLISPPGRQTRYSDIGFMILEWIIAEVSGTTLDRFVCRHVYEPLGIDDLFFIPMSPSGADGGIFAPQPSGRAFAATETCPWRGYTVKGAVHDENAFVMGGVAGQAGLFGTASSVHRLLANILSAYAGDDGLAAGGLHPDIIAMRAFDPGLVRTFMKQESDSGRALGFDMPSVSGSASGDYFNRDHTVGHLGFSGVSFWMDLSRSIVVILLTNRIHPSRANEQIRMFRPRIHNAVMTCPALDLK